MTKVCEMDSVRVCQPIPVAKRTWIPGACVASGIVVLALGCGGRIEEAAPNSGGDEGLVDGSVSESDSEPPISCQPLSPCGGDLVGSWTIVSDCFQSPNEATGCTGDSSLSFRYHSVTDWGTLTFTASGTWVEDDTYSIDYTQAQPVECEACGGYLDAQGVHASCSQAGTECTCEVQLLPTPHHSMGTYAVSASNVLTLYPDDAGAGVSFAPEVFCVAGDTLRWQTDFTGFGSVGQTLRRQ
jgi:hypothetical protein